MISTLTRRIDALIDGTTMYRLVLYYLAGLLAIAALLAPFKLVPIDATAIVFSTVLIVAVSWLSNWLFAKVFRVPANVESAIITALIIALIMNPVVATDAAGVGGLVCASVWAIASKFIFAGRKKHIFNPAAIGVALSGLLIAQPATWWVAGNLTLLPFVLVGGLLIDGYEVPPRHHMAILVEGNTITWVGPAAEAKIPPDATVLDTSGRVMMPGMVELHAHLMLLGHGDYGRWFPWVAEKGLAERVMEISAKQLLMSGVTSVVDLGGPLKESLSVRDRVKRGEIPGSRLWVSGPWIPRGPAPTGPLSFGWNEGLPKT